MAGTFKFILRDTLVNGPTVKVGKFDSSNGPQHIAVFKQPISFLKMPLQVEEFNSNNNTALRLLDVQTAYALMGSGKESFGFFSDCSPFAPNALFGYEAFGIPFGKEITVTFERFERFLPDQDKRNNTFSMSTGEHNGKTRTGLLVTDIAANELQLDGKHTSLVVPDDRITHVPFADMPEFKSWASSSGHPFDRRKIKKLQSQITNGQRLIMRSPHANVTPLLFGIQIGQFVSYAIYLYLPPSFSICTAVQVPEHNVPLLVDREKSFIAERKARKPVEPELVG